MVCDATHTSACPEATPLCLTSDNTCVECTAHADCDDPAKPLCSPTTHACVPCTDPDVSSGADAACDAKLDGSRCVESGALGGRCGACDPEDDQGCAAPTPQCLPSNATCVECVGAPDCAGVNGKPLCDITGNTCVECLDDTACGAEICATGSCVACSSDPDCEEHPAGTFCTADGCKACDPDGSAGCPLGHFCSAASYSCVECLEQSHCADEVCSSGVCSPCEAASDDCAGHPNGAVCVTSSGGATACAVCEPATEEGCAGQQCVSIAGVPTCRPCDPETNAGCPPNDTCDADTYACVSTPT